MNCRVLEKEVIIMAITNEQVKDFETKQKKLLFDKINSLASAQAKLITSIQSNQKYIGTNEDLPNIGITLNNKLVELSHQFQEAGISMFSHKIEDYGPFKLNFLESSIIGEATISDMIDRVYQGLQVLSKYSLEFEKMSTQKHEQFLLLEKSGPLKKFLLKLRGFQNPSKQIDLSYSRYEKQLLSSYLSEYSSIDTQLWKYTLRDNIIPSLVNYIKKGLSSKENAFAILDESVIPDLQKLGFEDLIPQLREELSKAYEEKTSNSWDLSPMEKLEMKKAQQQIAQKYIPGLEHPQIDENLSPEEQETNR